MSEGIVRSLGSGRFLDWKALNAEGASGGILICWDKRCSREFMAFSPKWKGMNYGKSLGRLRGRWEDPWCLGEILTSLCTKGKGAGGEFTWNGGHNNKAGARLDRFLVSPSWLDQFHGVTQSRLPRPISDHFPIILVGGGIRRGAGASFRLAAKMKEIKQKLKVWNREVFGGWTATNLQPCSEWISGTGWKARET
ncbi:hypothetical protein CK203_086972 [Vitis vinifera]|uniref:Endonuclease/exonuclease/phosphatase domain-containing protein n=1 Tax=Vitis vinifera TaxID=29760 RepID=A0A438FIV0_VITVI|nr:hypothetical protein CK203_086972 [Vitis vinifera]